MIIGSGNSAFQIARLAAASGYNTHIMAKNIMGYIQLKQLIVSHYVLALKLRLKKFGNLRLTTKTLRSHLVYIEISMRMKMNYLSKFMRVIIIAT